MLHTPRSGPKSRVSPSGSAKLPARRLAPPNTALQELPTHTPRRVQCVSKSTVVLQQRAPFSGSERAGKSTRMPKKWRRDVRRATDRGREMESVVSTVSAEAASMRSTRPSTAVLQPAVSATTAHEDVLVLQAQLAALGIELSLESVQERVRVAEQRIGELLLPAAAAQSLNLPFLRLHQQDLDFAPADEWATSTPRRLDGPTPRRAAKNKNRPSTARARMEGGASRKTRVLASNEIDRQPVGAPIPEVTHQQDFTPRLIVRDDSEKADDAGPANRVSASSAVTAQKCQHEDSEAQCHDPSGLTTGNMPSSSLREHSPERAAVGSAYEDEFMPSQPHEEQVTTMRHTVQEQEKAKIKIPSGSHGEVETVERPADMIMEPVAASVSSGQGNCPEEYASKAGNASTRQTDSVSAESIKSNGPARTGHQSDCTRSRPWSSQTSARPRRPVAARGAGRADWRQLNPIPKSIQVTLLRARNLPIMDHSKSDPFVVFHFGGRVQKSSVKRGHLNPRWEESFIFKILDPHEDLPVLSLSAYDEDLEIGKAREDVPDDLLGRADVVLEGRLGLEPIHEWFTLRDLGAAPSGPAGSQAQVELHIEFHGSSSRSRASMILKPETNILYGGTKGLSPRTNIRSRMGIWAAPSTPGPGAYRIGDSISRGGVFCKYLQQSEAGKPPRRVIGASTFFGKEPRMMPTPTERFWATTPGPGAHTVKRPNDFGRKPTNGALTFGLSVQFPEDQELRQKKKVPGPKYDVARPSSVSFSMGSGPQVPLSAEEIQKRKVPGPGAYNAKTPCSPRAASFGGGSLKPRSESCFIDPKTPGPGQYEIDRELTPGYLKNAPCAKMGQPPTKANLAMQEQVRQSLMTPGVGHYSPSFPAESSSLVVDFGRGAGRSQAGVGDALMTPSPSAEKYYPKDSFTRPDPRVTRFTIASRDSPITGI